jgi:hypothetical protein
MGSFGNVIYGKQEYISKQFQYSISFLSIGIYMYKNVTRNKQFYYFSTVFFKTNQGKK